MLTSRTGQCPSGFERFLHNIKTLKILQRNRVYGIGNFTLHLLWVIDWRSVSHHMAARCMGKILTETHIRLINGGSSVGVIRILADEVTNGDEEVIGIVPQFFDQLEINHHDQIELIIIDNMHNRKQWTDIGHR